MYLFKTTIISEQLQNGLLYFGTHIHNFRCTVVGFIEQRAGLEDLQGAFQLCSVQLY